MKVIHLLHVVIATIIIAALATACVLYPIIPLVGVILLAALASGIYFSPRVGWLGRIFLPSVFVADDLTGYGLRERPKAISYLTSIATIIDGITCGIIHAAAGKQFQWLIKPTRLTVNIRSADEWTDPAHPEYRNTDGTNQAPTDEWKKLYLGERAALIKELIRKAGWRAVFYRALFEVQKTESKGYRHDSEFILF